MDKLTVLHNIGNRGIVAVIRTTSKEHALELSQACIAGGITNIEVTYTVPQANDVIKKLYDDYKNDPYISIGAGTVLDPVTAGSAISSGSQFIVSPFFDVAVAKMCNFYRIPYIPGCATVTEMKEALKYGVDLIKLFPGKSIDPSLIKAIKAPLPQLNIMPTGGVNLDNIEEWMRNGAFAVGVGGSLTSTWNDGHLIETAKQYIQKIKSVRRELI